MRKLSNIYRLGIKELWSLARDPGLVVLILFTFTVMIYVASNSLPSTLHNAPIAVVDEDVSPLSTRIIAAFYPPHFNPPLIIDREEVDRGLDSGRFTFALNIPPNFQRDVLAGRNPQIQLNVDATRMSQAFTGNGYINQIVSEEIQAFAKRYRDISTPAVDISIRSRFNPNLEASWFGSISQIINNVTMLSIILTGAALIREREHGTIEHLLVMPVTPAEIMISKIWSMGLVVLCAASLSLVLIVKSIMQVPIQGSLLLFTIGCALNLFATTSMGIFLATIARSMPQFGLLLILVLLPMQFLSGGITPRQSMPEIVQYIMMLAPTTHFVELGQSILFRGAGLDVAWKTFLWLLGIGSAFFTFALLRFHKTLSKMA